MTKLSLSLPNGVDAAVRLREVTRAHESFVSSTIGDTTTGPAEGVRPIVLDSWRRSAQFHVDPDAAAAPIALADDELHDAQRSHPLHTAMPIVRKLLVDDVDDAGVLITVGDVDGHVLWTAGGAEIRRKVAPVNLTSGARWSEADIGTNGIGTALAVRQPVQVFGAEHFSRRVHAMSCVAAPVRERTSGDVVGFVNITGGAEIATPQAALLVRSTVSAIEAELALGHHHRRPTRREASPAMLAVLGRDRGVLTFGGRSVALSLRHTELLFLLAGRPNGMSAAELGWQLYEHEAAEVTVRAEMSRLRKTLPTLVSTARPYQLYRPVRTDADDVADQLGRGSHRRAVDLYRGPLLPRSEAPAVVEARALLRTWLREALVRHAASDVLLRYATSPDGHDDVDVWQVCLDRLPAGSPRRAQVRAALAMLHRELGSPVRP